MAKSHPEGEPQAEAPRYWMELCVSLRNALNLSQQEMATRLGVNQASLSRWERGRAEPQRASRRLLISLANGQGLNALEGLENVVRVSPFPMLLMDQQTRVIAASPSSGFKSGRLMLEQVPPERQANAAAFLERLTTAGFWDLESPSLDYEAAIDGIIRRAIVSPVVLHGRVHALVQKGW